MAAEPYVETGKKTEHRVQTGGQMISWTDVHIEKTNVH